MSEARTVRHDPSQSRYVIEVGGQEAGFAEYVERDGVRDFSHTVVDPQFRGQGLSSPLIAAALDGTREAGLRAKASCSAVERFVSKNEDYRDLIV
ncbi:GNAT family N-acetyltransferase [Corynebacterium tapiri]|uniref:N-acetyltransferase n=1 Tax=Corynebacterium tapiri TaxID=1448266 RepID=A0A5C4U180_9CORY|nr:GNAT family N-acetyltransferase [Corynebacterium tapiri]TNL94371.1 N-acetyltransferase [Corynebacterium tapiri]